MNTKEGAIKMQQAKRGESFALILCVLLVSFSLLAFEISLVRVLSVMLSYHYVFAVSSLALLGLGAGAVFVNLQDSNLKDKNQATLNQLTLRISSCALSMSVSLVIMVILGQHGINSLVIYVLVLIPPFFFGGMFISEVFRIFPSLSGKIHGADLIGAAAGCIGVVWIYNIFGGITAILFFSLILAVTAFVLFVKNNGIQDLKKFKIAALPTLSIVIVLGLLAVNLNNSSLFEIPIGLNPEKEIHDSLNIFGGEIKETNWNIFGRTDLVEYEDMGFKDIYLDGTAGSPMYEFNGDLENPNSEVEDLKNFPGYFPYLFLEENEKENVLIIGPGGGRDVLTALLGGAGEITAVEVNKSLVDMVKKHSSYNGGIYTEFENVDLHVEEGRNFVRRQKDEKYDLIKFTLPVTNTSRSPEGYTLTENYLFTANSISEYLDLLNDEGSVVVVAHDDLEMLRLLSLSLKVLEEKGINNSKAMEHVYMLDADPNPLFVLKKAPLTEDLAQSKYETALEELQFYPGNSYIPHIGTSEQLHPALFQLSQGRIDLDQLYGMVEERGYDIRPVTDNSPFFYNFTLQVPDSISSAMLLSIIMMVGVTVPSLFLGERSGFKSNKLFDTLRYILIFTFLGVGYMLIEITLIQEFILYLGYPILSLTVLLFTLLLGTGIGSIWSNKVSTEKIYNTLRNMVFVGLLVLLAYNYLIPLLFDNILGFPLYIRIISAFIMLLPLGFFLGIPFPLSIRALKEKEMGKTITWMWGINSVSSVLGSVLTIYIAINWGFSQALLLGIFCYFIILLLWRVKRKD